jgi:hypothetical protein
MTRAVRLSHGPGRLGGPSHLARLEGRLAVDDDGCVFAASLRGESGCAVAWPRDYTARIGPEDVVEVVDGSGNVVLREGDHFAVAGGLGPSTSETRHALVVHGRETFFIGQPVARLPG